MDTYYLKDKLVVTDDFLVDLETKSWQEIESLQSQIANIATSKENEGLLTLLNSLLTSYYVFVGGLENLASGYSNTPVVEVPPKIIDLDKPMATAVAEDPELAEKPIPQSIDSFEPFEYFVDFEEPVGLPLTDTELYGN